MIVKRVFDFILTILAILILLPFIVLISVLIKLTSPGPILFKQRRIGRNNKEFTIYKFRTMRIDTPNVATHLLKNPEEYITAIGKVLRKTSLDELPQLFNILKGEMSIVGPRPALYNQYDLVKLRTKEGIHILVPGLTGWAQINGRDELDIQTKVKYDKEYLEKYSLPLDLRIIFLTAIKVFKSEGVVEGEKTTLSS